MTFDGSNEVITSGANSAYSRARHYFNGYSSGAILSAAQDLLSDPIFAKRLRGPLNPYLGKEYRTDSMDFPGNIVNKLENTFVVTASNAANVTSIKTTLKEAGQSAEVSARTEFEYDAYDNRTKVTEYDFANTARRVVRTTYKSTFHQSVNYVWTQYNLVSLPDIETVYAGDGTTKAAETQFTYDSSDLAAVTACAGIAWKSHQNFALG